MAKLSAHGFEWLRVRSRETGAERSYRSDGAVLKKFRGGTWRRIATVLAGVTPAEILQKWSVSSHWEVVSHAIGKPGSDAPIITERVARRRAKARAARAVDRAARRAVARRHAGEGSTLAERRAQLEAEADPGAILRRVVAWNLLTSACGRAMFCSVCHGILDARRAVLATYSTGGAKVTCASCHDATPRQAPEGVDVTLYDGRELGDAATRSAAGMLS